MLLQRTPLPAIVRRCIAVLGAICAATVLFPFTAKPITWDEIAYMGIAFHPWERAFILNRYVHAYGMKPFMWMAGDPFVGTRLWWCALIGMVVGTLIGTALRLAPRHGVPVIACALFLFAGQDAIFNYPGIAYPDFSVMAILTVAFCMALNRVLESRDFSRRDAFVLGLLLFAGVKSKETAALIVMLLPLTAMRDTRRVVGYWLLGFATGAITLMMLDTMYLHDAWFSVRWSSWSEVLGFNLREEVYPNGSFLRLVLRRVNYAAFGLYLAMSVLWIRGRRDRRLLYIYSMPAVFLAMLAVLRTVVAMTYEPRYTTPMLPLLCLLGAIACVQFADETLQTFPNKRLARFGVAAGVAAVLFAGSQPALDVLRGLYHRDVQRLGDARYSALYEVAGAVRVPPAAHVLISKAIYGGTIRSAVVKDLARMSLNAHVPNERIVYDDTIAVNEDFAIVRRDEGTRWLMNTVDSASIIASSDGTVSLICLRAPCVRR